MVAEVAEERLIILFPILKIYFIVGVPLHMRFILAHCATMRICEKVRFSAGKDKMEQ